MLGSCAFSCRWFADTITASSFNLSSCVTGQCITAWSVSLNPKGGTYASTGGSGNVSIHSADSATFGERRTTLPSGRSKFGMYCKHVGSPSSNLQPYHYLVSSIRLPCTLADVLVTHTSPIFSRLSFLSCHPAISRFTDLDA